MNVYDVEAQVVISTSKQVFARSEAEARQKVSRLDLPEVAGFRGDNNHWDLGGRQLSDVVVASVALGKGEADVGAG